ncbi:hypothetical protein ACLOJK_027173 [Asimina triloba]
MRCVGSVVLFGRVLRVHSVVGCTEFLANGDRKGVSCRRARRFKRANEPALEHDVWGYESIYEEDALSVAATQLAAWKERLEMNAQWEYEEDALSAAATQLAAWKERLEMNVVISPTWNTCGATHSTEGCPFPNDGVQYMEQYNPNPTMSTPQSPFQQPTFNLSEEKAPQVEIPTFPPIVRILISKGNNHVPPEV